MASGSFTDYSTLKSDLEQTIKSKDEDVVELDDDFFETAEYRVINMTGIAGLTDKDEPKLVWEEEIRFENVDAKDPNGHTHIQ